jgi:uncharacterized protein YcbK (DUF882 family)
MVRASINEKPRHLFLHHSHTGEELDVVYRSREGVSGSAAKKLDHFFRDFRTEEATQMDPALFDLLYDLKARVRNPDGVIEIISAYRSPVTNEMLRKKSSGVARKSFHTRGQALDIRLRGTSTSQLKKIALAMGRGGVGYYRRSDFIHVDTGPVRTW